MFDSRRQMQLRDAKRREREREREGVAIYQLKIKTAPLTDWLEREGYLERHRVRHSHAAVLAAFADCIADKAHEK